MMLTELLETVPDYARDLKLNLSNLLNETVLTETQRWGVALTAACVARNSALIRAIETEGTAHLSLEWINACKIAASLMGMNNVYYRFGHFVSNEEYRSLPAKLRMQGIARPGIEKVDFELLCLVASAINGCAACCDSHEKSVRQMGLSTEGVQAGVRIGAVVHGLAVALELV